MVKLTNSSNAEVKLKIAKVESYTGGSIKNYEKLENKPSISGHTLVGDSSLEEIGVEEITDEEIHSMFK